MCLYTIPFHAMLNTLKLSPSVITGSHNVWNWTNNNSTTSKQPVCQLSPTPPRPASLAPACRGECAWLLNAPRYTRTFYIFHHSLDMCIQQLHHATWYYIIRFTRFHCTKTYLAEFIPEGMCAESSLILESLTEFQQRRRRSIISRTFKRHLFHKWTKIVIILGGIDVRSWMLPSWLGAATR